MVIYTAASNKSAIDNTPRHLFITETGIRRNLYQMTLNKWDKSHVHKPIKWTSHAQIPTKSMDVETHWLETNGFAATRTNRRYTIGTKTNEGLNARDLNACRLLVQRPLNRCKRIKFLLHWCYFVETDGGAHLRGSAPGSHWQRCVKPFR